MRRIIITALVALTALGGVASADRNHRNDGNHHRQQRFSGDLRINGGVRVDRSRPRYQSRTTYRPVYRQSYRHSDVRVVRQPIYIRQRPVIRYRYTNYYQRPTLLVESFPTRAGYFWVAGQWQWSGFEWVWQPGHYEPDPSYSGYYDSSYDMTYSSPDGYYDDYGNWVNTGY